MLRSGAEFGTLKLHPLLPNVETLSSSMNVAFNAFRRSTSPHPSWLLGAVSPAPFVEELYCPIMSCALVAKIALTKAELGS